MTLIALKEILVSEGIPAKWFLLDGKGIKEDKVCLEQTDGKWSVFYSERGKEYDLLTFATESAACDNLLVRLRERKRTKNRLFREGLIVDATFESEFSKLQADMVSVCLDYCAGKCDRIYIHSIIVNDTVSSDFFFCIDGALRKKGKLNGADTIPQTRQKEALKIVSANAMEIIRLFEKHKRPVPFEVKIIYDAKTGAAQCDYGYDVIDNTARSLTENWFNAINNESDANKSHPQT
jgi:hypothetical protein